MAKAAKAAAPQAREREGLALPPMRRGAGGVQEWGQASNSVPPLLQQLLTPTHPSQPPEFLCLEKGVQEPNQDKHPSAPVVCPTPKAAGLLRVG